MKNENKFRNNQIATAIAKTILSQKDFCKLYNLSNANMNTAVETSTNRVVLVNEDIKTASEIVKTMNLQSDFMSAVSRITVWLDSNAIIVFVGAVFSVFATTASNIDKSQKEEFKQLFNSSIDKKYNERKLKNKTITALTETRHSFTSIEEFNKFFELLTLQIVARKQELSATESDKTQSKRKTKTKEIKESETKKA